MTLSPTGQHSLGTAPVFSVSARTRSPGSLFPLSLPASSLQPDYSWLAVTRGRLLIGTNRHYLHLKVLWREPGD